MRVNTTLPGLTEEWARAEKYIDQVVETTNNYTRGVVLSAWPGTDRRIGLLIRLESGYHSYTDNEHAFIVREER